jgi:hypothetical protein
MAGNVSTIEGAIDMLRQVIADNGGEMPYDALRTQFPPNLPPDKVVQAARSAFRFRLVANSEGGVDHLVSLP